MFIYRIKFLCINLLSHSLLYLIKGMSSAPWKRYKAFLTITLAPEMYRQPANLQFENTRDKVYKLIKDNVYIYRFKMVAELTQTTNIHYHAVLEYEYDEDSIHLDVLRNYFRPENNKSLGFMQVKPMITDNGATAYIIKDIARTSRLLKLKPDRLFFEYERPVKYSEQQTFINQIYDLDSDDEEELALNQFYNLFK